MLHGNQYLIPLLGPILRTCLQSHLQTHAQPLISHNPRTPFVLNSTHTKWKFSGARVCRVTFKHLPQVPNPSEENTPLVHQKCHCAGGRGVSDCFKLKSSYFYYLGANANLAILEQLLKMPPLSTQKCHSAGGRGVQKLLGSKLLGPKLLGPKSWYRCYQRYRTNHIWLDKMRYR